MKKFSIVFFLLLVLLLGGMSVYVAKSKDFEKPVSTMSQEAYGIDEDSPIWDATMDDLAQYLYDNGVLQTLDYELLSEEGVSSVARQYGDLDLYWWDIKNLDENSEEYKAYKEMEEDGMINLWGSGNMMAVTRQGPFGIWTESYGGNLEELMKIYHSFGTE